MNLTTNAMQRRRILFLISLPRTPEYENEKHDVEECIAELRELNVDVHQSITPELLASANQYDIVIVVAHNENDRLVLSGSTLSMEDFIESMPTDFNGILDFSSCYSANAFQAIKSRCPQCKVQASLVDVKLIQRIIIYPSLVQLLNENLEIAYNDAYKEVSSFFRKYVEEKKEGQEDVDYPEMTKLGLGQQLTSVYAPKAVVRNSIFYINVFLHYDSDKGVIHVKNGDSDAHRFILKDFEIPVSFQENEMLSITLSFDSEDNDNIKVINNVYRRVKSIEERLIEQFGIILLPDFHGTCFIAKLQLAKDDKTFALFSMNVSVSEYENTAPATVVVAMIQGKDLLQDEQQNYAEIVQPWMPEKAAMVFKEAWKKGWIEKDDDGFKWIGFSLRNGMAIRCRTRQLAYLCDKAFALDNKDTPWIHLKCFFNEQDQNLQRDLFNVMGQKDDIWWKEKINELINQCKGKAKP